MFKPGDRIVRKLEYSSLQFTRGTIYTVDRVHNDEVRIKELDRWGLCNRFKLVNNYVSTYPKNRPNITNKEKKDGQ